MTTREAFEQLTKQRGWYKELDIPEGTASALKNHFKTGKITIDKMEEILERAGYRVIQEKKWQQLGNSVDHKM